MLSIKQFSIENMNGKKRIRNFLTYSPKKFVSLNCKPKKVGIVNFPERGIVPSHLA